MLFLTRYQAGDRSFFGFLCTCGYVSMNELPKTTVFFLVQPSFHQFGLSFSTSPILKPMKVEH